jgi:imidazolonepropionase
MGNEQPTSMVISAGRVVTCDLTRATSADPLHVIENGAVWVKDGIIVLVGTWEQVYQAAHGVEARWHFPKSVMMPGLVDAHTHAAWVGSRHHEYVLRMRGEGYEAIAKAGGGIVASRNAIREASQEQIADVLRQRLQRMMRAGVTTVEVKSGYGLDEEGERKQLEAIAFVSKERDVPDVVPTYLALHALPPEYRERRAAYVDEVTESWLPAIAKAGLARYVDAYLDRNAFQLDEARPMLEKAQQAGLGVRLHVGQFADIGGAELAAELHASSADHLENVSGEALGKMAKAGTAAVLLPVASWTLGQNPPPVAQMRNAGVKMVVASDANPGTSPTESLWLAIAMAVRGYGLSPEEALLGATVHAAQSLGLEQQAGTLSEHRAADLSVWPVEHEWALVQPWGLREPQLVLKNGNVIG